MRERIEAILADERARTPGIDEPLPPSRIDQALTLAVLAMLIVGCFFVLQPFITALVWAAILCTTTWPLYLRLAARLDDRDGLAAFAMVVLLALLMLAPFIVVGATIADNAALMAQWGRDCSKRARPIRRRGLPACR